MTTPDQALAESIALPRSLHAASFTSSRAMSFVTSTSTSSSSSSFPTLPLRIDISTWDGDCGANGDVIHEGTNMVPA
ncbi:hypothetical protein M378DRAFT_739184 [Amanita muscaria Koide BX008]|uniref:Uncharacterized protein n=1 Tax=Amanita muscaria (strain Koide BX008) TaxID=946122 RepID=A0A0C2SI92_AMAMK|nr:hypothetical protein M378DRAFT_739184 [Amanita muscaria Koide BX008]